MHEVRCGAHRVVVLDEVGGGHHAAYVLARVQRVHHLECLPAEEELDGDRPVAVDKAGKLHSPLPPSAALGGPQHHKLRHHFAGTAGM